VLSVIVALSIGIVPLKRGPLQPLSADESKEFWHFFQLVMKTVSEFFKNTYELQVEGVDDNKLKCNVFSVDALDKFWSDLYSDSARIKLEKALDLCETDALILLKLSACDYSKAKEFFANLDRTESQQM